jgi:hypothetical protein
MVAAGKVQTISLTGLQPSERHYKCMGVYKLAVGMVVSGRGVWKQVGEGDRWLFYVSSEKWFVSDEEDMVQEKGRGWIHVSSTAITPDRATEMWQAGSGGAGGWIDAPKLRVRKGPTGA